MKTDQNSNMQGTLNKRISMKKRRNAKRALLALNLVAVIFTTTVFSNPVSVLSEEVSTDAVQSIENSPGTDAQIAEQADVQQNTAEAAQAAEAPAEEDMEAEVPSSAAMPAVTFDQKVNTENGTVMVHVDAEEGAFEDGTSMAVTPVTRQDILDKAIDAAGGKGAAAAMDITFTKPNGTKTEPLKPIHVKMISPVLNRAEEAYVVHVTDSGSTDVVAKKSDGKTIESTSNDATSSDGKNAVSFESDSFSVYAIVYTVDFEYSVNGKMYQFSLPGGGKIALSDLIEVLGIIGDTNNGEKAAFNSVDSFLKEVDDIEFSDESLVKVTKNLFGNDWTLESLQAFDTEETLNIVMQDGSVFHVIVKDAQYITDISSLLTEAILKLNGEEIQDGATLDVKENTQFELEVKFEETDDFQFSNDGTLTYKLPDGFVLPDGFEKTVTLDLGLDGKLYKNKLTYDPTTNTLTLALNRNDPNYSAFTASGTASIDLKVNGYFDYTESHVEFSPDLSVTVTKKDPHDANVTKEGSYDKATQTMTYTVRVTADGSVSNLNVSDHMSGSSTALSYQSGSITVKSDERPSSAGARTNPVTWTESSDGFDAVIPDMVDGEVITFEYKATVDPSKVTQSGNASFDEMGNTVRIHNDTVDKEATHVYHNIEVSDITKNALSVSEVTEEDGRKYQTITWEIVTNDPPEVSLAGSKITDTMTGGMVGNSVYNDDVKIYVYDSNGQLVEQNPRTPSLQDLGISDPQSQKTWTYNIPTTDGNYKYVIQYSTKVDVTYVTGMSTAMNDVTGKGGSDTGTAPVGQNNGGSGGGDEPEPVDDGIGVSKQTLKVTETEVDWVIPISVEAKEGGYDSFVVTETFPHKATGNQGFIDPLKITDETNLANNIIVSGLNNGESYIVEYLDPYTDQVYTNCGKNTIPRGIKITFKKADGSDGLVADSDRIITIRLTTVNDTEWLDYALNNSDPAWNTHTNSGDVNSHPFSYNAMPMKKTIYKKLHNTENNYNYTYPGDSQPTQIPKYEFRVSVGGVNEEPLEIEDVFPSDLFMILPGTAPVVAGGSHKTDPGNATKTLEEGIDYQTTDTGVTFTINDLPKDNGSYYGYYIITYYVIPKSIEAFTQIKMDAADNDGTAVYKNIAMLDEDNKSSVEFTYDYKILDKTATAHDGYVTYTITINKDKMVLNNGEDMTLFDSYSKNQTIDFSTITVTEIDPAENRSKVSWDFSGYVGSFNIPDATKVVITYNAKPVGETEQTLTNKVYMNGYRDDSGETKVVGGSGAGSASSLRVRIFKYESGHMESGLNNAFFRLLDANKQPILDRNGNEITFSTSEVYMYTQDIPDDNDTFQTMGIAGKKKDVIETSDAVISAIEANSWVIGQYVKKVSGYANILLDENATGAYLKKDTRYYLEEYQAATEDADGNPASFKLPTFLYSFMISDHPDYNNYIYSNNDVMTARNDRDNGGLDIVKQWGGSAELTDEQKANIYFQIEKKNGENWEPYTHKGIYPDGHIPYSELSDDVLHLTDVPVGTYRVTEHNAEVEEYNLLTTYTVDGQNASSSTEFAFIDDDVDSTPKSHNVTITNKYDVKGYEFTKVDSNTLASLPGAVFKVKKQSNNSEVKTYTTGSDGKFMIQLSDGGYEKNTLYYVEETDAPDGYTITEDKKFYFYFSDETADGAADALTAIKSFEHSHDVVDLTTDGGRETVENEKGELTVTKEWKNQNGGAMSPGTDQVTVTLKRYTMVNPAKTINVTVHGSDNTNSITMAPVHVNTGAGLSIKWWYTWGSGSSSDVRINGKTISEAGFTGSWEAEGDKEVEITLSSVTDDMTLDITTNHRIKTDEETYSVSAIGEPSTETDPDEKVRSDDDSFSREYKLRASDDWSHTWTVSDVEGAAPKVAGDIVLPKTDGNGNEYYYYVEEEKIEGFVTTYEPASGGSNTGDIKVINTGEQEEPQTGSLKITKTVKLGGQSNGTSDLTDGTYSFTVYNEDGSTVATKADNSAIGTLSITFAGGVATPSELTVDGLTPGTYVIKETGSTNEHMSMVTEGIIGYESNKEGIVVIVTAGSTADVPTAAFVNDYEMVPFEFTKEWHDTSDQVDENWRGDITVTVQRRIGSGDAEIVGKYTIHKGDSGFSSTKDTSKIQAPDLANESGFTFKITDLPKNGKIGSETGEYTYFVTEETVTGYRPATYSNPSTSTPVTWITSNDGAYNGGKIINTPESSYELPSTGGPGTRLFMILGSILILGAGVLLLKRRKLI